MSGIIERAAVLVYGVLAIVGLFVAGVVAGDPVAIVSAVLAAGLTYLSQSFFNYAADCSAEQEMWSRMHRAGVGFMLAVCLVWFYGLVSLTFFEV